MQVWMDMLWIETRKALRSRMPLGTGLGALCLPLAIGFLVFVARNPAVSQKLGLISAKANLVALAAVDWPAYLNMFAQFIALGGFFLFVLVVSWIFGREFADGTVKDLLAVPAPRAGILAAKFTVAALWSLALALVMLLPGLLVGVAIALPGAPQGVGVLFVTIGLTILAALPFGLFASAGRGYLLPIGLAVLAVMAANLAVIVGRGEVFPWAVPALYAQGKSALPLFSYALVGLTAAAGMLLTGIWWTYADQDR